MASCATKSRRLLPRPNKTALPGSRRPGSSWRLFGYRLRPGLGATFEIMATLLSATLRGLVIMALTTPGIAAHRAQASPFGAATTDEWSLPAMGTASIASAVLEPDPAIQWDDERTASQSSSPSRSTPSSCRSPPPGTAMPPSAARKSPRSCSPAGSQDARSAPASSPDVSASSASIPGNPRSAALFQLATDLLARMLGIHITVAVAWQRASAGDWMAYAADVSRRSTGPAQPAADTQPTPT
jgi:hypothetical protein